MYTQLVADNVDHNICTIDGQGTFHGMGVIAIGTQKTHNQQQKESGQIRRIESILKSKEITSKKQFPITWYEGSNIFGLSKLAFKPLIQLYFPTTFSSSLEILWHSSLLFGTDDKRPNWSRFMQEHSSDEHPPDSKTLMLPIINLNPSDDNCIYSTLLFIHNQAKILNIETPAVTFDQALWIKAIEIVTAKNMNIVVRLGGFYMLMNFVGSIGYLMDGSGLYRLMETIYAKTTVPHIMPEKAIARASRSHFIVDSALTILLLEKSIPFNNNTDSTACMNDLKNLYEKLIEKEVSIEQVNESPVIINIQYDLENLKRELSVKSRTAKLWIQYVDYISIINRQLEHAPTCCTKDVTLACCNMPHEHIF